MFFVSLINIETTENMYFNYLLVKSNMAAIFFRKIVLNLCNMITNLLRMVVLVAKCMFLGSRNNLKTTRNLYCKYVLMKSKMATISKTEK